MLYSFYTVPQYIIYLYFTLEMIRAYTFYFNIIYMCLYLHVFLFTNFNINFMLYLFYTRPYYTIYTHFTLIMTCRYVFYFNIIYICLYLRVFLFKNFNINLMLYIFVRDLITPYAFVLLYNDHLHFILVQHTSIYIYMCLYLKIVTSISCCI